MIIKILAEGGAMKPGPALSQKLGPAGIPVNQVIQKVNDATKDFKGMKVPVELDVDVGTKEINVKVFSPPASELLKKEFGIEKGSGDQKNIQIANASIEQIISVAKTKMPNLLCNDLKSAVKTILGSCVSLGMLVENKPAVDVISEIDEGKFDKEIKNEQTETSEEKKEELKKFFEDIKAQQEKIIKAKQAETEKKEEPKEEKK
jgi:large subunit ribosomal protein L11